jgi:choline-glycine betaine transporter
MSGYCKDSSTNIFDIISLSKGQS